jgi:hypothetical protein
MAANPNEIANQRFDARQAETSDEKRMVAALEQISDCTEAIRQDLVNFQAMVERFILSQRVL